MKTVFFLVASLALVSPSDAQTVYKCGSTYSQTPCAADAKKIEVKPAVGVDCSNYNHMFTEACRRSSSSGDGDSVLKARDKVKKQIEALPPSAPPTSDVIEANKKLCLARIMAMLKDPESARVGEVTRSAGPTPDYDSTRGWFPSISYLVNINAKNSYGGYTGNKLWSCSFDLKERELLKARSSE